MPLSFFKKHKKEEKKTEKPKTEPIIERKDETEVLRRKRAKRTGMAFGILKSLHVTEKATDLSKNDQYVFRVFPEANKTEIKKAIEEVFNVDVLSVNILKAPSKRRRLGRISGWKKGYKKAVIKIRKGQKIEIIFFGLACLRFVSARRIGKHIVFLSKNRI